MSATPETLQARYAYDEAGQLVREDNAQLSQTVTYTYDKGGNITEKSVYPFTTGALGTATDAIGNPWNYTHDRYFTWSARDLQYAELEDGGFVEYRYNENGLRCLKRMYNADWSDSDDYYYFWSDDGRLLAYTVDPMGSADHYSVLVLYNSDKEPIGFTVDEDTYYYLKNIQGDVLCVTDAEGTPIVNYTYDAWGMMTVSPASQNVSNTILARVAFLNPVTYRGYFYDYELGLYYLQSRYYDPETGRFISADDPQNVFLRDCNFFSYCYNNPVNYLDKDGNAPKLVVVLAILGMTALYSSYLCVRLYLWGFYHRKQNQTYSFTNKWTKLIEKRVRNSSIIKQKVNQMIRSMERHGRSHDEWTGSLYFYDGDKKNKTDLDLMLSIGGGDDDYVTIKINKTGSTYQKTFKLNYDVFDFDDWKEHGMHTENNLVAFLLNQAGFLTQKLGAFVPYTWTFSLTYS